MILDAILAGCRAADFPFILMHGIHKENQGRWSYEDYMKHPESVLRDRERHVVAHLFAAWLEGVAGKLLLLIIKQVAGNSSQDQHPEDEHEQQPEASKHWRVGLQLVKEISEEAPFTHVCSTVRCSFLEVEWQKFTNSIIQEQCKYNQENDFYVSA